MNSVWIQSLAVLSISTVLHGCAMSRSPAEDDLLMNDTRPQATRSLSQTTLCCHTFKDVSYVPLNRGKVIINSHSPTMMFAGEKSYFYAAKFLDHQRSSALTVQSLIGKTVFPVQLQLLDAHFQPTRTIPFSDFAVTDAKLLSDPSLKTQFSLLPEENYLIIYANMRQLDKTITIPHPEQLKEKAMDVKGLSYSELEIPFSPWGLIDMQIDTQPNQLKNLLNTQTPLIDAVSNQSAINEPSANPKTEVQMSTPHEEQIKTSEQTHRYYRLAIQQAVVDGHLEQAMQLVSEGKRLGITDVEQTFIDAVKQQK